MSTQSWSSTGEMVGWALKARSLVSDGLGISVGNDEVASLNNTIVVPIFAAFVLILWYKCRLVCQ